MAGRWLQSGIERLERKKRPTLGGPISRTATFKPLVGPPAHGRERAFLLSPDMNARERMPFRPQGDGSRAPGESEKQRRLQRIALSRMQVEPERKR